MLRDAATMTDEERGHQTHFLALPLDGVKSTGFSKALDTPSRHAIYTGPTGVKNFVLASPQRPSYDVQPPARLRYARAAPHPRRGPAVPKMDLESADSDLPSRALNDTPWADSLRSRSLPRQVQTAVKKGIVARAAGELKRARGCRSVRSSSPGLFWSHTSLPSPS
ncbi:hypothetical protein VTJ04DRAFT_2249 [Mycothermus thermophilus]|uniref:uncharacterized protein n=1 Tax=Humicola insolens TaxID=85995 RepID=UPI003744A4F0